MSRTLTIRPFSLVFQTGLLRWRWTRAQSITFIVDVLIFGPVDDVTVLFADCERFLLCQAFRCTDNTCCFGNGCSFLFSWRCRQYSKFLFCARINFAAILSYWQHEFLWLSFDKTVQKDVECNEVLLSNLDLSDSTALMRSHTDIVYILDALAVIEDGFTRRRRDLCGVGGSAFITWWPQDCRFGWFVCVLRRSPPLKVSELLSFLDLLSLWWVNYTASCADSSNEAYCC